MIYKNIDIHNGHDITTNPSGVQVLTRVPPYVGENLSPIGKKYGAFNTVGIEFRFLILSEEVKIDIDVFYEDENLKEDKQFGLYWGNFQTDTIFYIGEENHTITIKKPENMDFLKSLSTKYNLAFDPEVVRIIAPTECQCKITNIEGVIELPKASMYPKKRWLAYGSSITQGSHIGSYASLAADKLGVDLFNLGFGGSALLEPQMADFIASRNDFDMLSLELGINMIWDIEHNCPGDEKLFQNRVDYFIPTIAKAHPDKPIFCISIFTHKDDYEYGPKTQIYREIVRKKVEELNMNNLIFIDGTPMIRSVTGLLVDLLHPSKLGCQEIAQGLSQIMSQYI